MIKMWPSFLLIVLLFLLLMLWAGNSYCSPEQNEAQQQMKTPQEKKEPENIAGGPQGVKQKTDVGVFVAWMWISIISLVFFLRLKIKEIDRLYRIRFFSSEKK
jgi:Na+/H+ antiporter NhaC